MLGNSGKFLEKYITINALIGICFARETSHPDVSQTLPRPAPIAKHSGRNSYKYIYYNDLNDPCFARETVAARSGHDRFACRIDPARHPRPLSARSIAWHAVSV
jgi:hypothetical protein